MDGAVNPENEQYGSDCIQYARDPSALPRYRIGSGIVGMSERIQVDEGC